MNVLSPDEDAIMRETFKATMFRAADIVDKISESDVLDAQAHWLRKGMTLQQVAKIDRAMIAARYLRMCADGSAKESSPTGDSSQPGGAR